LLLLLLLLLLLALLLLLLELLLELLLLLVLLLLALTQSRHRPSQSTAGLLPISLKRRGQSLLLPLPRLLPVLPSLLPAP
jgi:hypothetical protein